MGKGRGRPGGNPDLKQHQFQAEGDEPLSAKLSMRVTQSMLDELKQYDGWQDLVREAIAAKLKELAD